MKDKVKSFGSGAIVMGMIMTLFAGVMAWVGVQASEVPKLQESFKIEITHLNKNIQVLTDAMKENTSTNARTISRLSDDFVETKIEVMQIKSMLNQDYTIKSLIEGKNGTFNTK